MVGVSPHTHTNRTHVCVRVHNSRTNDVSKFHKPHTKSQYKRCSKLSRCHCNGSLIIIRFGKSIANVYVSLSLYILFSCICMHRYGCYTAHFTSNRFVDCQYLHVRVHVFCRCVLDAIWILSEQTCRIRILSAFHAMVPLFNYFPVTCHTFISLYCSDTIRFICDVLALSHHNFSNHSR